VLDFLPVNGFTSGNPSSRIVRFSTFEVDLQTGELRQRGQKIKLQEQPFQVLVALLERPGDVVTRDELRSKLWPADTFVDFDHSLNAAIKRLRDALGESAEKPIFIETLARRGYRFIAPVDGSSVPIVAARVRGKTLFSRHWIAVTIFSFIIGGVLTWFAWRLPSPSTLVVERKLTANSSENTVSSAAVSRDGKYLAYTDSTGVYLKLIRTGETHPVPLPPNFSANLDDWFPDGSHLLVTREERTGAKTPVQNARQTGGTRKLSMWSISVFGGSPRQLTDDGAGGSVSPDGSHVAFQRNDFGREEWVMRSDGTDQVKVAADQSSWVGQPRWSLDGNRIAYIRMAHTYNVLESSIEVNEWRNPRAQTLLSDNRLGPSVYWLPNGLLIYTLRDPENVQGASLWAVLPQQSGKILASSKRITRGIGWINQVTGSTDGKLLTFTRENTVSSVYIGALARDGTHLVGNRRLTLDENQNLPFAWTPDSKAVLFSSNRNGTSELFKQVTDQPLAESMMTSAEELLQPRVTPDGSEILYISTPKSADLKTPSSILAIPIAGGTPRRVLQDVGIWNVQCSPLPSAVCMYSNLKGDRTETFRFDVRTGKRSDPPQSDPWCNWSLSPDGSQRAIACGSRKGTIQLRSALTAETRNLTVKGWDELGSIVWSVDGRSLLTISHHESDTVLLNVALDGRVSVLLRSSNPEILGAIPSPDGRSLAIAGANTTRNVWQIENF
jgi:DNA-binding winged helix-turn-helix (wHTH) protein/Tol biopolymer transport system component